MKKLVLTGLLVLSAMAFAAKITTTGKSWEKIEKENKVPEQEISIMNFSWLDKKDGVEGVYNTYSFKIGKLESDKNNNFYLSSYYDEKPENGLPLVSDFNNIKNLNGFTIKESLDENSEVYVSYYKIRKTAVKGIYYIDNYIGQDGKKHPKLYFGFDEKSKKVVITDKNGNIKNILEYYPAG